MADVRGIVWWAGRPAFFTGEEALTDFEHRLLMMQLLLLLPAANTAITTVNTAAPNIASASVSNAIVIATASTNTIAAINIPTATAAAASVAAATAAAAAAATATAVMSVKGKNALFDDAPRKSRSICDEFADHSSVRRFADQPLPHPRNIAVINPGHRTPLRAPRSDHHPRPNHPIELNPITQLRSLLSTQHRYPAGQTGTDYPSPPPSTPAGQRLPCTPPADHRSCAKQSVKKIEFVECERLLSDDTSRRMTRVLK